MKNEFYIMRPPEYVQGLNDLINYINQYKNTKEMTMVEIGAYAGESTVIFSKHFKNVITIDPYKNNYDKNDPACNYIELENVYSKFMEKTKNIDNITLIKKTSNQAFKTLKNKKFDFIYIDGLHKYKQVKKDIENYIQLVNQGGFIAGHDYHDNWIEVKKAIIDTIQNPDKIFKDTSWIKLI